MMPNWNATTEHYMQHMMKSLGDNLKAVVVNNTLGNNVWDERIPAYSTDVKFGRIKYVSRAFNYFGLKLEKKLATNNALLNNTIQNHAITHILCQFGDHAYRFMDFWRENSLPLFVHFHGSDLTFDRRRNDQPNIKVWPEDYLGKIHELSNYAIFITNSMFSKDELIHKGIDASRIVVNPSGVPIPEQKKMHIKTNNITILHLGRLMDCKSPDRTIQAFEIAKNLGFDGRLVIAGDGPMRVTCELMRLRSPWSESIRIIGSVSWEEGQKLLSEADIFAQHNICGEITRQTESYGFSILEAMAHGLPVVGTKNGGVVETVIDGKTGILNDPGDVNSQAEAFLMLAKDPGLRTKMGSNGRERVMTNFNLQQEAQRWKEIMDVKSTRVNIN